MFAAARQGLGRVAQAARPRAQPARRHMSADVRHSEPINLLGRAAPPAAPPGRSGLPLPNGSGGQKFTQKTGFARPRERPETERSSCPKTPLISFLLGLEKLPLLWLAKKSPSPNPPQPVPGRALALNFAALQSDGVF